jgi:hypothetical protein
VGTRTIISQSSGRQAQHRPDISWIRPSSTISPWLKPSACAYCGSISTVSCALALELEELKCARDEAEARPAQPTYADALWDISAVVLT